MAEHGCGIAGDFATWPPPPPVPRPNGLGPEERRRAGAGDAHRRIRDCPRYCERSASIGSSSDALRAG